MGSLVLMSVALTFGVDDPFADIPDCELAARASNAIANGLLEQADEARARPHFQDAALYYDELRRRKVANAALYRNLGNAHFLADDIPQAILAYRRGLRVRPRDDNLRTALASARALVYLPAASTLGRPPDDDAASWLMNCPPSWLTILATTLYLFACLATLRWWMTRSFSILCCGILLFLSALATTAIVSHIATRLADERAHPLVVICGPQVKLLQGNGPDYPPRYPTPARPGVEGRLLFERDGWLQIELPSGEIGWVAADQVIVDRD